MSTAGIIVVVVCVCVCVCVYVCVYVCVCVCVCVTTHNCRLTHWNHTKGYQRVHSNTAMVLNFADFPKNASFKSYGVIY